MCTGRNRPNTAASFDTMRCLKSPSLLDLFDTDIFGVRGEAVGKNHYNNNIKNDVIHQLTPPEQPGEDVSPLTWNQNGGDANDMTSALIKHTEVTQLLVETVEKLTAAIEVFRHGTVSRDDTVHRKSHNKKFKRYKNYVTSYLKSTKNKKATRCTLRRNLNSKIDSHFLSHVLKDLVDKKHIAKDGNTYALMQN